ncbi:MAG: hypothetical protein AAGF07_02575 [Patescibacteria group bacterium]
MHYFDYLKDVALLTILGGAIFVGIKRLKSDNLQNKWVWYFAIYAMLIMLVSVGVELISDISRFGLN